MGTLRQNATGYVQCLPASYCFRKQPIVTGTVIMQPNKYVIERCIGKHRSFALKDSIEACSEDDVIFAFCPFRFIYNFHKVLKRYDFTCSKESGLKFRKGLFHQNFLFTFLILTQIEAKVNQYFKTNPKPNLNPNSYSNPNLTP